MCGISNKTETQGSVNDKVWRLHQTDGIGRMHVRGGSPPGSGQVLILTGAHFQSFLITSTINDRRVPQEYRHFLSSNPRQVWEQTQEQLWQGVSCSDMAQHME